MTDTSTTRITGTPVPPAESARLRRMHMPERAAVIGTSVREADRALNLNGGGGGLLDTTHFDTVRFPPPAWAKDVINSVIEDGEKAYTPYRGNPEVLAALATPVSAFLGTAITPANLALTPGTQAGLFTTLSAIIDEGDLVMLADPEYVFAERMLAFLGARVVRIPLTFHDSEPTFDLDAVEALLPEKPVLFMYSNPNNPTGAVFTEATVERLAELSLRGGFRVLADELYSRLVYEGVTFTHMLSIPGMADRCITMLGPSKTESLSGYRLGVVVGPPDVMEAVEQTLAATSLRAPAYAQHLLTHWLVEDEAFVAERILDLAALRDLTLEKLRTVPGLTMTPQGGTAYLFVDTSALGVSDQEIAKALQQDAGVIVSPGYQFGPTGVGHFRVCYARDEAEWAIALDRMVASLSAIAARQGVTA